MEIEWYWRAGGTNQVQAVGATGDRSQFSVILTAYTSENSSAATLSSCLRPAEEQPAKGTTQEGRVASLALPMPAAFLHEEQE